MKAKKYYLILSIITALIILYFSTLKTIEFKGEPSHSDKIKHFFAYALLSFLLYKTLNNKPLPVLIASIYGITIEFIQLLIPYRTFEFYDVLFNFAGASLVFLLRKKECLKKQQDI